MKNTFVIPKFGMIAFVLLLYFFLVFPQINKMHSSDEVNFLVAGLNLSSGRPAFLYSPPLYTALLSTAIKFLGLNNISTRIVGIICVILSCFLVLLISGKIGGERGDLFFVPFISMLILCIHPMIIQGSLICDIDNTIMVPILLLFVYSLIMLDPANKVSFFFSAITCALLIWTKLSTPVLFIFTVLLFLYCNRQNRARAYLILKILLFGSMVFLITWVFVSKIAGLSFFQPFEYAKYRVGISLFSPIKDLKVFFCNLVYFSIWFCPYLALALGLILFKYTRLIGKGEWKPEYYLVCGIFSFMVYLIISPLEQGFPKYYVPLIPMFSILAALELSEIKTFNKPITAYVMCAIFILAAAYFFLMPLDIVYDVRYTAKKYFIFPSTDKTNFMREFFLHQVLFFIPLPVVWALFKNLLKSSGKAFMLTLLILGVSSSLSLSLKQASAKYLTNYSYGEKGTKKAVEFIREGLKQEDKVIAAGHILYYLNRYNSFISVSVWEDKELFLKKLKDASMKYLAYSLTSNSVISWQRIFNNRDVLEYLNANFKKIDLGDFTIWKRTKDTYAKTKENINY